MSECLICLGATRKHWRPPTPCDCRVNVHKICWERWADRAGEICVICRAPEPRPVANVILFAPPPAAAVLFPPPHQFRCFRRIVLLVELGMLGLIVYVLLYMATYQPTPVYMLYDRQSMPSWLPRANYPRDRDEL
jgi:hypothetical protein